MNGLQGAKAAQSFQDLFDGRGWKTYRMIDKNGIHDFLDELQGVMEVADDFEFVVFTFNGHGTGDGVCGNTGVLIPYSDICAKLDCRQMRGQPKVLILERCQGGGRTELFAQSADEVAKPHIPKGTDFPVGYASGKGTVSWGGPDGGAYSLEVIKELKKQRASDGWHDEAERRMYRCIVFRVLPQRPKLRCLRE